MSSDRDRIEQYRRWIGEWFRQYDRQAIAGNSAMWHRACAVEEALVKFERLFPPDEPVSVLQDNDQETTR